jgi:ABC-type nitrate/sulfonate/bicarbonate transport system permease component
LFTGVAILSALGVTVSVLVGMLEQKVLNWRV